MLTQIFQLFDILTTHNLHALLIIFAFSTTALIIYVIAAKKHKDSTANYTEKTSTIIPVYKEKPQTLQATLTAIKPQTNQLIVIADEPNQQTKQIITSIADEYIFNNKKLSKRNALNQGLLKVKHPITLLIDSDAILSKNAVTKIIKPFGNKKVGIVQGRTYINKTNNSKLSNLISKITENSRDIMCKALNDNLIVADGRFQAIRTSLFQEIAHKCITDKFMGKKILTGDDRQRTRLANSLGYKTLYQSNATCQTEAQPTFKMFLKQQLRWNRSGYIYFFKDIKEHNIPSKLYLLKSIHYYLAPIFYLLALALDAFVLPATTTTIIWYITPITLTIGITALTMLRQTIMFGIRKVEYKWLPILGFYGLFIAMPLMLYALVTTKKACISWETR